MALQVPFAPYLLVCNYLFRERLGPIKLKIYARESLGRQEENCFLNSEMPKNLHACPK